eukprot:CAMPEP_0118880064 /NCGR_PEP_ID=MMETSP1163-20130328/19689_1 /TAXON_ID=124430 /ORGANISM="Phaeomonas parva, Strain CCMP2877" /LENGTH=107 /DNA_ID=CAMNT_0006816343 /DNA_START=38 /DNA_END=358 /DNA_ORIENTATION=-
MTTCAPPRPQNPPSQWTNVDEWTGRGGTCQVGAAAARAAPHWEPRRALALRARAPLKRRHQLGSCGERAATTHCPRTAPARNHRKPPAVPVDGWHEDLRARARRDSG